MTFLKIKKGDFTPYRVQFLAAPKEQAPDSYGKKRWLYPVLNMANNAACNLDASEALAKGIASIQADIGTIATIQYKDIGDGKTKCTVTRYVEPVPVPPPAPPAPPAPTPTNLTIPIPGQPDPLPGRPEPTRDERIEKMYMDKRDSIHDQCALKLAVASLSEKDKERPWFELKVLLPEREVYFLERIEGELRADLVDMKMQDKEPPQSDVPKPEDFAE